MPASNPVYTPQSLPDWNEAVEQWVVYLPPGGDVLRPSSTTATNCAASPPGARGRGLTPYSVSRVHIDDYVVDIRTERNLGGRSIAARLTALRQFFKWMGNRESSGEGVRSAGRVLVAADDLVADHEAHRSDRKAGSRR